MNGKNCGDVELPSELRVGKFAEARITEILGLQAYIDQPRQGQAAAQQLPRHLRRRAVSHNPNRLPRRLRERHLNERKKSGCQTGGSTKRPSRKYRRRPRELLLEYNRRQKEFVWLETHIWHAKRFHMTTKWGYKLPEHPNDKSFRACYRASAKKCLMQDVSFLPCIEVQGPESALLQHLSALTPPVDAGVGFSQGDVLTGTCEGRALVYHPRQYPSGVIGQVQFLWRESDDNKSRTLWIWSHPANYDELKDVLLELTEAKEVKESSEEVAKPPAAKKARKADKNVNATKLMTRNVPFSMVPCYESSDGIVISLLKNTLNRFRLVGPMSTRVLTKTLLVSEVMCGSDDDHTTGVGGQKISSWWREYYSSVAERKLQGEQADTWKSLEARSPGELKSGTVLALTVRDPRVTLPGKRGGIEDNNEVSTAASSNTTLSNNVHHSPLWISQVRDAVTMSKVPDTVINQRRSQCLVPGSELALCGEEARIPVLLIQQPGCPQSGFGVGFDLIVPAGWGMSFWMNLVFQGARVGGLREMRHLSLEKGFLNCICRMPDSTADRLEKELEKEALRAVFFSHPPDKRCNYIKLGVTAPFSAPWSLLVREFQNEQTDSQSDFFVLRSRVKLRECEMALKTLKPFPTDMGSNAIVPVRLDLVGKGNVCPNSMVCIPSLDDLVACQADSNYAGPLEPVHDDCNEKARKELHAKHQKRKTSLRRKWKVEKDKLTELRAQSVLLKKELDMAVVTSLQDSINDLKEKREKDVKSFNEDMQRLWVDIDCQRLGGTCSREIMGFVVDGGYSYRVGHSVGFGFVPALALAKYVGQLELAKQKQPFVLVREPTANQYRWARLYISTHDI